MTADAATSRRRGVRVLSIGFLALFLVLCVAALVAWRGLDTKPTHWTKQAQRIAAMPAAEKDAVSQSLQNRLLGEWSSSNNPSADTLEDLIGERRRIEIPFEDLNVWLSTEGIELLESLGIRMPSSVRGAMIDSAGKGLLRLSFEYNDGKVDQVVALSFDIDVADDGGVTSRLAGASAGRLPIPTQTAIDLIRSRAGTTNGGRLIDLMTGTPTGPIDMPIDAYRDGRLVGLEVTDRSMIVIRETIRAAEAN